MARSGVLNVYIEDPGPRATWVFKLVFEELLGMQLNLAVDPEAGKTLVNYSSKDIPGSFRIVPHGLLSQKDIQPQEISMNQYEGMPVFFSSPGSDLPFDPFSMIFYLVSRYEEYLPFKADAHGRFPHAESLAYQEGFLHLALVNRLALKMKSLLQEKFPELACNETHFHFTPTVDIDIAFAHLGKGWVRTWGAILNLLLKGNPGEIGKRFNTMRGKARDPYDNFNMLADSFSAHGLDPIYFILAGDPGPYDRNLSTKNKKFAALLKSLAESAELGIHPSYGAGHHVDRIMKEIRRVEEATARKITKSRQHFVRMSMPDTYLALAEAGITDDFSMGYASISGFRAGIASPFRFYNLRKEVATDLVIHPFMFMDTTLGDYLKLDAGAYAEAVLPIIKEVKEVNGQLVGIWHNYALADDPARHMAMKEMLTQAAG